MKKVLKCLAASALIGAVITTASCKKVTILQAQLAEIMRLVMNM